MQPFQNAFEHIIAEILWLKEVLRSYMQGLRDSGILDEADAFRGLHIPATQVHALLKPRIPEAVNPAQHERLSITARETPALPLVRLVERFGLEPYERAILIMALAPELDS